jgi:hypothetical protein
VTLLILASLLDSPLAPFNKQAVPSDTCPRPALFQSWMIVQIFRLVLCWSVSCWVALRQHRASRNEQRIHDSDQEARLTRCVYIPSYKCATSQADPVALPPVLLVDKARCLLSLTLRHPIHQTSRLSISRRLPRTTILLPQGVATHPPYILDLALRSNCLPRHGNIASSSTTSRRDSMAYHQIHRAMTLLQ